VFRIRNYSLYFLSRFFSALAFQMNDVGVGWLVYERTHDPLALGLVGLSVFLPGVLLILVVGQVADWFDRRRILTVCYILVTLICALLYGVARDPETPIVLVYVLMFAVGTVRAFSNPAGQALAPTLVPPPLFASAVAANSSAWQTATILGPALGGFAYLAGAPVVFAITTGLGLVTVLCLVLMTPVAMAGARMAGTVTKVTWESLTAGFRFIAERPLILGAISLDLFAVLLGGAVALLPFYADNVLHMGPDGLGILRAMPAVGAVLMALVLARWPLARRVGRTMFVAVGVFGVATIVFGLTTSIPVAVAALLIMGVADMVSVYIRQTLVQLETPDAMRGRVSAVNALFIGASNQLGEFESGLVASWIGPVGSVVVGGLGTLVIAALWLRLFPALRDRDRLV
jgi:MFS family permease